MAYSCNPCGESLLQLLADVAVGCLEVVRRAGIAAVAGAGCAFASALCAPTVIVTIYMAVPLPCVLRLSS